MGALDVTTLRRPDLLPGPVRTINMARLGEALTDPELDPPIARLRPAPTFNDNRVEITPISALISPTA